MHLEGLAERLPEHARLLQHAVEHYRSQPVIGLFLRGSLAIGEGDRFSDIDLHVVVPDGAYQTLLEERPGFMRSLGHTLCEWRTYGEHQYMCLYETGIVLEVLLHRAEYLQKPCANTKMKIIHDPQGQLAAFQQKCDGLTGAPEINPEALLLLWQQVWAWLWRGVGQTLRGEVWEGRDYLEFLRERAVMPLYRTLNGLRPEGYRRLERWAEPAFLQRLEETVAPPEAQAVLSSLLATNALIEELCQELAVVYGVALPSQPTQVRQMAERLINEHAMA